MQKIFNTVRDEFNDNEAKKKITKANSYINQDYLRAIKKQETANKVAMRMMLKRKAINDQIAQVQRETIEMNAMLANMDAGCTHIAQKPLFPIKQYHPYQQVPQQAPAYSPQQNQQVPQQAPTPTHPQQAPKILYTPPPQRDTQSEASTLPADPTWSEMGLSHIEKFRREMKKRALKRTTVITNSDEYVSNSLQFIMRYVDMHHDQGMLEEIMGNAIPELNKIIAERNHNGNRRDNMILS